MNEKNIHNIKNT